MVNWSAVFTPDTPLLELVLRGTVLFFALLVLTRVVGQRESGGLGMSDLIVAVLLGATLGDAMTGGGTSVVDGLVPVATVMLWSVAVDAIAYRWPPLTRILKGKPRPLISDGRLDRAALRRELISMDELLSQLRTHELDDISQVRRAYLEPNGEISIIPMHPDRDSLKT
jgi:uncharacterized membrane protein YcaP (DUF421 family)